MRSAAGLPARRRKEKQNCRSKAALAKAPKNSSVLIVSSYDFALAPPNTRLAVLGAPKTASRQNPPSTTQPDRSSMVNGLESWGRWPSLQADYEMIPIRDNSSQLLLWVNQFLCGCRRASIMLLYPVLIYIHAVQLLQPTICGVRTLEG